jgi:2-polyprenyl-6-methoxyphenol hydroxylase-like FAD-dependent oxidoreductase
MYEPVVRQGTPPGDLPEVPVAIVGAGACGLTAALLLKDAGIDAVLLERDEWLHRAVFRLRARALYPGAACARH